MSFYTVTLLDIDGYELACNADVDPLSAAKRIARDYVADHEYPDRHKAEVRDADSGVCEFDVFAKGRP